MTIRLWHPLDRLFRAHGRVLLLAWTGLLVWATVGFFENQDPSANATSQFDLTRAIVERGTFRIDAYQGNTIDKAFFEGHYYCDKSPVNAFLAVPPYAAYYWLAAKRDAAGHLHRAQYLVTATVEGAAAAVLAILLAIALARRGAPFPKAVLAAALWICATPLLGYSIVFYNYLPACAFMMGSFLLIDPLAEPTPRPTWRRALAAGLLMGLACWTLNTMAIAALAVTFFLAHRAWSLARTPEGRPFLPEAWRRLAPWAIGGLVGIAGYFIYNHHLFHSFKSPYRYEADALFRAQMAKGLMGATRPRLSVAWLVTFHKFQGLFLWFPLTALAMAGLFRRMWQGGKGGAKARAARAESLAAVATFLLLLTYVSAYFMWWGGNAYAPRHLIPALPLMALGLVPWIEGRWTWRALLVVAVLGAMFNVTAIAVNPQPHCIYSNEALMKPEAIAHWQSPYVILQERFWLHGEADLNLGQRLGLGKRASLLPLAGLWACAGVVLACWSRRYSKQA
jgi:hypothetical protein